MLQSKITPNQKTIRKKQKLRHMNAVDRKIV